MVSVEGAVGTLAAATALLLATLGACFSPRERAACEVACDHGNDGPCPAGLVCGAANLCRPEGADECPTPDAHTAAREIAHVAVGGAFACALDTTGQILCWGDDTAGQSGLVADGASRATPRLIAAPSDQRAGRWTALGAGERHACAAWNDGERDRVYCWGANDHRQSSPLAEDGLDVAVPTPAFTPPTDETVVELALGGAFGCALVDRSPAADDDGARVVCWGAHDHLQLGPLPTPGASSAPPVTVFDGHLEGAQPSHVTAGGEHACIELLISRVPGEVRCWGGNAAYQLGRQNATADEPGHDAADAVAVTPLMMTSFIGVAAGADATCAIGELETFAATPQIKHGVQCWGDPNHLLTGGLGGPVSDEQAVPRLVGNALNQDAMHRSAVTVGDRIACRLFLGVVACWGSAEDGSLGDGNAGMSALPSEVALPDAAMATEVDAGEAMACALTEAHAVYCWGKNDRGQVGVDGPAIVVTPQLVAFPPLILPP